MSSGGEKKKSRNGLTSMKNAAEEYWFPVTEGNSPFQKTKKSVHVGGKEKKGEVGKIHLSPL